MKKIKMQCVALIGIAICARFSSAFVMHPIPKLRGPSSCSSLPLLNNAVDETRRSVLIAPLLLPLLRAPTSYAVEPNQPNPDLPPDAIKSYLQYRFPLQFAADYYMFELKEQLNDFDKWGEVNSVFESNGARGAVGVSRLEREFINPMRILVLSMPPEESEDLRDAMDKFERSMRKLSIVTKGVRRDLPVDLPQSLLTDAQNKWEEGRVSYNSFISTLNKATELNELKLIASSKKEYPRSERRYVEFKKKLRTCQNRGGPALSQAWGQLMVSGYMQDSCGIPDIDSYLFQ